MSFFKLPIILTDIEGTTSSIAFVKDVLFPYAAKHLPRFVAERAEEPEVRHWLDIISRELQQTQFDLPPIINVLHDWIKQDRKHTALKALQGMLWLKGYKNEDYRAHIYPDALNTMQSWHAQGYAIYVYSSGSVEAQKLFFKYSSAGDLLNLFSGHFDTQIGNKRDPASYLAIIHELGEKPSEIIFLSDIVEELDAARDAGMRTVLVDRREDYPVARKDAALNGHNRVERFDQIQL